MTSNNTNFLVASINSEYRLFDSLTTADDRFNCLNNIIELKRLIPNNNLGVSLYIDFKRYYKYYIQAVEDKDSDYDQVIISNIRKKTSSMGLEMQLNLLKYVRKLLLLNGYPDEAKDCSNIIQEIKIEFYKQKNDVISFIKLFALWSSISLVNLVIVLISFFLLASLFLLETKLESFAVLNLTTVEYTKNYYLNHLINTLTLFFDLDSAMKVEANCFYGVVLIIIAKIFYLLILVNFFAKKIVEFIKINE